MITENNTVITDAKLKSKLDSNSIILGFLL